MRMMIGVRPFRGLTGVTATTIAVGALLTTTAISSTVTGQEYESSKVKLFSQIDLFDFGSRSGNDCWGYVSPSGREYAIMGLNNRTGFVEITDPVNPVIVHNEPHSDSFTGDIKVLGHYAYSCGDGYSLQIFDLSDIDNGVVTLVDTVGYQSHNIAINEDSEFLYLCASSASSGITALDLSDRENPVNRGSTNPSGGHVHDAQVVTYESGPYAGREIAFCPSGYDSFDIIDVTNKSNMTRLSSTVYQGLSYSHQGWLSEDRRYFYLDDEIDEINGHTSTTRTLVFDVTDLSDPELVNTFTTGQPATDHNLFVHEGFVYEANYNGGFHVFDARSDPIDPDHVGWFDTYPENNRVGYGLGAWSSFPFYPSGRVVVSDINRGLFVLDVTEARGERMGLDAGAFVAGQDAMMTATGATANGQVYFIYSLVGEGWTRIPALGVYADVVNPALGGSAVADGAGSAELTRTIPGPARGRTVWVQALEPGATSVVIERVVQ